MLRLWGGRGKNSEISGMLGLLFLVGLVRLLGVWGESLFVLGLGALVCLCGVRGFGPCKLRLSFELDGLGGRLILLSIWVVGLSLLARAKVKKRGPMRRLFLRVNFALLFFLALRFRVSDFMYFYLRFECRLIPVFLIILG